MGEGDQRWHQGGFWAEHLGGWRFPILRWGLDGFGNTSSRKESSYTSLAGGEVKRETENEWKLSE